MRETQAMLLPALRSLARLRGALVSVETANRAVADAFARVGASDQPEDILQTLRIAAEDCGFPLVRVPGSVREALSAARPEAPWFCIRRPARGAAPIAIAVWDTGRWSVSVSRFLPNEEHRDTMSRWTLRRRLGVTRGERIDWLVPASSPVAWEHGEHDHDDDHGHEHAYHGAHPVNRLRELLKAERSDVGVVIVYSVVIGLLYLVVPVAVQSVVNTVAFGTLVQPLVILTLAVLAALGMASVVQALRFFVAEIIQRRIFVRVAGEVADRLVRVKFPAFDVHHGPELVNRFLDVVTVQKSASMLMIDGLSILMQTVIGMILLALYHPWLLAFDILLLTAIGIVLFPLGSGAMTTAIMESRAKYSLMAWLEEIARHQVTFKAPHGMSWAFEQTNSRVRKYLFYRARHFRILVRQLVFFFVLPPPPPPALLAGGGWLVMQRQLTLGQLVAAELIVTAVVSNFAKFGKHLESFYDLLAAMDKLGQLSDLPPERSGAEIISPSDKGASVRFRNASFSYHGRRKIIDDVNWYVPPGARIGLIGTAGGGKSTLFDLIYGLRTAEAGGIEIDDHDLRDINLSDLRSHVSLVRGVEVFEGSIGENLRMGNSSVSLGDVRATLAEVGLLEDVTLLPEGLQTRLSTGGLPLSPSQAMRVMLARALLHKPRLLLIDEALDPIEEARERQRVIDALFSREAPWTLIVISSSQAVLERCDSVYALDKGKIRPTELSLPANEGQ
ncbi:MAG: peptidase domain-containing ABC transporter [Bryobacteraceae bacterium]